MKKPVYDSSEEERYVDPDETKKEKLLRYLGYYKIPILVVLVLAVVFGIMTKSLLTKEKADFYIFFVTSGESSYASSSGSYDAMNGKIKSLVSECSDSDFTVQHLYLEQDSAYLYQGSGSSSVTDLDTLKTALIAGTCMCVIGDLASIEYIDSLGLLADLSLSADETAADGKVLLLNTNEKAAAALELEPDGEALFLALRVYEGTLAEKSNRATLAYRTGEALLQYLTE